MAVAAFSRRGPVGMRPLREWRSRQRALLYRDALSLGVERAEQVLGELERKVQTMLDLRRQTTIHRDGSSYPSSSPASEDPARSPVAAPSPLYLRFGGALFRADGKKDQDGALVFVSDEPTALAAVRAPEAMALAEKWQQAGPCQLSISSPGPPGGTVSIHLGAGDRE